MSDDVVLIQSLGTEFLTDWDTLYHAQVERLPQVYSTYWLAYKNISKSPAWASAVLSDRMAALRDIQSMEALGKNWDGYGANPISTVSSSTAKKFISSLPNYVPVPEISPNSNGTISLEWQNEVGRAHLEIGRTQYSLYFRRDDGGLIYRDGRVEEIDATREGLQNEMFSLAPPQDYTIAAIDVAEAA